MDFTIQVEENGKFSSVEPASNDRASVITEARELAKTHRAAMVSVLKHGYGLVWPYDRPYPVEKPNRT